MRRQIALLLVCALYSGCATVRYQPTRQVQTTQGQADGEMWRSIGLTLLIAAGVVSLIVIAAGEDKSAETPKEAVKEPRIPLDPRPISGNIPLQSGGSNSESAGSRPLE